MYDTTQRLTPFVSSHHVSVEQALTYLDYGWSVIPVILRSDDSGKIIKRPAIKWQVYQDRRPSEEEVRYWFGIRQYNGIGVVTGKISALVVVDIEHGATTEESAGIESPLESRTINDGRHVFYRWAKPISNGVRLGGKLIDIRGDGGFVVLPPSQLGTKAYSWLKKAAPRDLPFLPDYLEMMVTQSSVQSPQTSTLKESALIPPQVDGYPSAKEGERNSTAAKVAGSLCANITPKLWEVAGWPALCRWNQTHCTPPLAHEELRQVWTSITGIHQRNHLDRSRSNSQNKGLPTATVPIISWKEFSTLQFKEPEWIISNLIPKHGLVAVAGPPESCKSYFTTYLGIAVARGQRLFDQFATKQTPVLLIDQENLPVWIQQRFTQFHAESDLPLYIYADRSSPFNLEDQATFVQVSNYIETHEIGLVILDTLRLSHNRDENSSTDMKPVFERLKALAQKAAVLFIQHHRKMDRNHRDKMHGEDMMGSMLIRGSVDYQMSMIKVSDVADSVTQIKVSQTKARYTRNLPPFTLTLEESTNGLTFIYDGAVSIVDSKLTRAKQVIIKLLKTQPLTRQELMSRLTADAVCSIRTGDEALKQLRKSETINRDEANSHAYSLSGVSSANLQACNIDRLQIANVTTNLREKNVITNDKIPLIEPQQEKLQSCNVYIETQTARSDQPNRENGVTDKAEALTPVQTETVTLQPTEAPDYEDKASRLQVCDIGKITSLANQQIQTQIRKLKLWLLQHERSSSSPAMLSVSRQIFDVTQWKHFLQRYCLLIDTAQDRGIARDEDWLEMGRMIFHADDGTTGRWLPDQLISDSS